MQIDVLSFTKPLQSMILIAALSCCFSSAARADADDTYSAAHSFGTDVLSVFCQNSLQAMEKWTMDFSST